MGVIIWDPHVLHSLNVRINMASNPPALTVTLKIYKFLHILLQDSVAPPAPAINVTTAVIIWDQHVKQLSNAKISMVDKQLVLMVKFKRSAKAHIKNNLGNCCSTNNNNNQCSNGGFYLGITCGTTQNCQNSFGFNSTCINGIELTRNV